VAAVSAEMTYTEQLLHLLDDFDTSGGLHIKLNGGQQETLLWEVRLVANKGELHRCGYIVFKDDGDGYGWGPVSGMSRMEMGLTAEQALAKVKEHLRAEDAARRLGRE
jgi:hypothetical protein